MSERPEFITEAWRWVEKADHDLCNAEYVLTMPENCPIDTVASTAGNTPKNINKPS
ncbi:MAG: hypothetical protein ACYC9O_10025 [Candidatus Latescibacterota bacterium]